MFLCQLQAELIQRQITLLGQTHADPRVQAVQLADPPQIALTLGRKRPRLQTQLDHVIHKSRRNPEMSRRLAVAMTLIDKGDNARA